MKKFFAAVALLPILILPVFADSTDDVLFVSLTRRPDPISKLPVNISVLTAEDLRRLGVTNLPEALRFLPGVKIEGAGSQGAFSKIKIRGVPTSNQIQILIDDQPLGG